MIKICFISSEKVHAEVVSYEAVAGSRLKDETEGAQQEAAGSSSRQQAEGRDSGRTAGGSREQLGGSRLKDETEGAQQEAAGSS